MKKPDFILVGESRCGSTSLYETLTQHPQIILPTSNGSFRYEKGTIDLSQKELRFFDRNWGLGSEWYFNRFRDIPGTITGDASATYLFHEQALSRIKLLIPETKIVILLRNPTDRFISHFYHLSRINKEFEKNNPDIKIFANTALTLGHHILNRGIYHRTVGNCLKLFQRSQILIIKSEEMFSDPQIINKIWSFLEVRSGKLELKHLRQSNAPKIDLPNIEEFYRDHNNKLNSLLDRDFGWS